MTETRIAAPLIAILIAWLIHWLGGFPLLALATLALAIYGWASRPARNNVPVADLMAGQWLALWALSGRSASERSILASAGPICPASIWAKACWHRNHQSSP